MENLEEVKKAAEQNIIEVATKAATQAVEETNKSIEGLKAELSAKDEVIKSLEAKANEAIETSNKASAEVKKQGQRVDKKEMNETTLKSALAQTIIENESVLKSYNGQKIELTSKALSPANFSPAGTYTDINTDRLPGVYANPYAPIWLRNIFPNATTTKETISYLKRVASTGSAAVWKRGTGSGGADVDKPNVTPNFVKATATVEWIAGLTDVPKEMLQDEQWLASYIPDELLYSEDGIMAAENKFIIDYLAANAVDYTGTGYSSKLEDLFVAAFGQLGSKYLTPTHILINNYDYLKYIAFNKASGSGEYDFPNFTLTFVNNQMFVNGLVAVPVPDIEVGTAYVVAARESQFVIRTASTVEVFEQHKDNVSKNLVTFRAEERVTFFTKNANSIVKVPLESESAG